MSGGYDSADAPIEAIDGGDGAGSPTPADDVIQPRHSARIGRAQVARARRALRPVRHGWERRVAARRVRVAPERGIVSFTFDDVPRSAYTNGVPLLEAAGISATFYVASQFCEPVTGGSPEHLTADDVADLHARGHQIACHTRSHRSLVPGEEAALVADCRRNREVLSSMIGGDPIEDFAFPFGRFTLTAKRALANDYASLRSTQSGLNVGTCDLSLLYCHRLTVADFDPERITALLADCARRRGWLLFFTHGVLDDPDEHSVDPAHLAWVIEQVEHYGLDVRTVAQARRGLRSGPGLGPSA